MTPNLPFSRDISDADSHLNRLLVAQVEEPWYRSFINNIREFVNPPKLPPLQVTSKPVPVKDIWGFSGGQETKATFSSILIHSGAVALLIFLGTNKVVQQTVKQTVQIFAPVDLAPPLPEMAPKKQSMGGGGGGGDRSPLPVSKGRAPEICRTAVYAPVRDHAPGRQASDGADPDWAARREAGQQQHERLG